MKAQISSGNPEIPEEILLISRQQMQEHRHHPVMRAILRFLKDWREAAKQAHTERWAQGSLLDPKQEEQWAIRVQEAEEISNTNFDTLAEFYGLVEEEKDDPNVTQGSQDRSRSV